MLLGLFPMCLAHGSHLRRARPPEGVPSVLSLGELLGAPSQLVRSLRLGLGPSCSLMDTIKRQDQAFLEDNVYTFSESRLLGRQEAAQVHVSVVVVRRHRPTRELHDPVQCNMTPENTGR